MYVQLAFVTRLSALVISSLSVYIAATLSRYSIAGILCTRLYILYTLYIVLLVVILDCRPRL